MNLENQNSNAMLATPNDGSSNIVIVDVHTVKNEYNDDETNTTNSMDTGNSDGTESVQKRGRGRPRKGFEKKKNIPAEENTVMEKRRVAKRTSQRENRQAPKAVKLPANNKQWALWEKKAVLKALTKYNHTDYEKIANAVKTRNAVDVEQYINKLKRAIEWKGTQRIHTPLLSWTFLCKDIVNPERKDYTDSLSTVMSIISNFETHPKPGNAAGRMVPDYSAIYRYLALLLQGKELPDLGPLESAIILDLMHGIVTLLRTYHTEEPRRIMKMKYDMLTTPVKNNNVFEFIKIARKGLNNDFSDYKPSEEHSSTLPENDTETPSSSDHVTSETPNESPQNSENESESESIHEEDIPRRGRPGRRPLKKGIKRRRKSELEQDNDVPKKPALFTLNPFCVPVGLLKLKPKVDLVKQLQQEHKKPPVRYREVVPQHRAKPQTSLQPIEGFTTVELTRMPGIMTKSKQYMLAKNTRPQINYPGH